MPLPHAWALRLQTIRLALEAYQVTCLQMERQGRPVPQSLLRSLREAEGELIDGLDDCVHGSDLPSDVHAEIMSAGRAIVDATAVHLDQSLDG